MPDKDKAEIISPGSAAWERFKKDRMALVGTLGIAFLMLLSLLAPFICNQRPFILYAEGRLSFPFLRYIFAPEGNERMIEQIFNYFMLFIPVLLIVPRIVRGTLRSRTMVAVLAVLLAIPFFTVKPILEKRDWRAECSDLKNGGFSVFAPFRYAPNENVSNPYEYPSLLHPLGTDHNGRDVLARMVYGARVSIAVGILATALTIIMGIIIGLISGYFGKAMDVVIMRIVEIIMCFPTFLLLLILMAIMMDRNYRQSIILVILVIGLTSWTGLSRIVRGEVLKEKEFPYIKSCEALGLPVWRILLNHILPNIMGPIMVSFTFGVAGAILAESGLSFLGFGVQPPTASWGELLRQSMNNPMLYWHLTVWPGLAIFISVVSFNFAGEGLRNALDPKY